MAVASMLRQGPHWLFRRGISRAVSVSINTVTKLLADVGSACADYQDRALRNLTLTNVHFDEIWAFVGAKQKNVPADADPTLGLGDRYTYTAIDRETKLMPCYMLGYRNSERATQFMQDLASRLACRVQITTDGTSAHPAAVDAAFGRAVDYATLTKTYQGGMSQVEVKHRDSPGVCTGSKKEVVCGEPVIADITTSPVERAKLTMHMGMRRFTRLTNGYSKKFEMHFAAVSLHFMQYNFARVHKSLRVTPAMRAGICGHIWCIEEIVRLVTEPAAAKRGSYKPRAVKAA